MTDWPLAVSLLAADRKQISLHFNEQRNQNAANVAERSSSAVAEKPRCRKSQFCVGSGWRRGSDNTLHQTLSVRKKLKALSFYTINPLLYEKRSPCVFEPLFGAYGATYAVHLRLIEKPVVDLLLVIIELFSLGATVQALRANIDWKLPFLEGVCNFCRKFQV